jgi:predicted membrane protein
MLAGGLSLIGLVFPFLLGMRATGLNQSLLTVMMLGICAAFVHGFGFTPGNVWARRAVSPAVTWPVMLGTCGAMLLVR